MKLRTTFVYLVICLAFAMVACSKSGTKTTSQPGVEQAVSDAVDAYIYGYPLVTMDMTRKFFTNYATVQGSRGPMGQMISSFTIGWFTREYRPA